MRELKELKLWLEGQDPDQIKWRLDPKNLSQVMAFVGQYAATVGGRDRTYMMGVIKKEWAIAARIAKEVVDDLARREALENAIQADYIANGGTEGQFKSRKAEILHSYALAGRSREVQERIELERRQASARTF